MSMHERLEAKAWEYMQNKLQRPEPYHVDVVRRVESGHVLYLGSFDLEEIVGQVADDRAEGWALAGPIMEHECREGTVSLTWYSATLVRGIPGAPMGVEVFSEEE